MYTLQIEKRNCFEREKEKETKNKSFTLKYFIAVYGKCTCLGAKIIHFYFLGAKSDMPLSS